MLCKKAGKLGDLFDFTASLKVTMRGVFSTYFLLHMLNDYGKSLTSYQILYMYGQEENKYGPIKNTL